MNTILDFKCVLVDEHLVSGFQVIFEVFSHDSHPMIAQFGATLESRAFYVYYVFLEMFLNLLSFKFGEFKSPISVQNWGISESKGWKP